MEIVEKLTEEQAIEYNNRIDEIKAEISGLKESINLLKPKLRRIEQSKEKEKSTDSLQREELITSKFKTKVARLKECLEELRKIKLESKHRQEV